MQRCDQCGEMADDVLQCYWCTFSGCEPCFDGHDDCPGRPADRIRRRIAELRGKREQEPLFDSILVAIDALDDMGPEDRIDEAFERIAHLLGDKLYVPPHGPSTSTS